MRATLTAVILLIAVAGCGGKKTTGPRENLRPYRPYLVPATPKSVLYNMQIAYSNRDSIAYKSLFDSLYAGLSTDQSDGSMLNFTKADEAQHIAALARSRSITMCSITFPPSLQWFTDSGDPAGWATIQIYPVVIQIDDNPTSMTTGPNETMEFKFVPTTPAAGSPTDTTWKIIRWSETNH